MKITKYKFVCNGLTSYSCTVVRGNGEKVSVEFSGYVAKHHPNAYHITTDKEVADLLKKHENFNRYFRLESEEDMNVTVQPKTNYEVIESAKDKSEGGSVPQKKGDEDSDTTNDKAPDKVEVKEEEPEAQEVTSDTETEETKETEFDVQDFDRVSDAKNYLNEKYKIGYNNLKNAEAVLVAGRELGVKFPKIEKLVNSKK